MTEEGTHTELLRELDDLAGRMKDGLPESYTNPAAGNISVRDQGKRGTSVGHAMSVANELRSEPKNRAERRAAIRSVKGGSPHTKTEMERRWA